MATDTYSNEPVLPVNPTDRYAAAVKDTLAIMQKHGVDPDRFCGQLETTLKICGAISGQTVSKPQQKGAVGSALNALKTSIIGVIQ